MTVEVSILIALASLAFGIYQGVANMKRNQSSDDKREASEMTTVLIKLESIQKDTSEIKTDLRSVKQDIKKHDEMIYRMDESLKSAWHAINKLQGGDHE